MALGLLLAAAATDARILVLPPAPAEGSRAPSWLGEVISEAIPADLTLLGVAAVERAERLRAHDLLSLPPVAFSRATSVRLGEMLGASRIVLGTYDLREGTLSVNLRLLDVERGTLSAPIPGGGPWETALRTVHGLSWDLALAGPSPPSGTREEFLGRHPVMPAAALQAYGLGLSLPTAAQRMESLKKALQVAPGYDEARLALARLHLQERDPAGVLAALTGPPIRRPFDRPARFLRGTALIELSRYREAATLFAALVGERPTAGALNNQALALMRLGSRSPSASELLRRAVDAAPGALDLPFNLGWALLNENDNEAACFWLKGVVEQEPRDGTARLVLAWALKRAGRAAEADEEWKQVERAGEAARRDVDLTRRYERVVPGDHPVVVDRTDVEQAAFHVGRADTLLRAGDGKNALAELSQAMFLDPYSARAHHLMARLYLSQGDRTKAVNELKLSLWCRDDPEVRRELEALGGAGPGAPRPKASR